MTSCMSFEHFICTFILGRAVREKLNSKFRKAIISVCLSLFDHFVRLALIGLIVLTTYFSIMESLTPR